MKIQLISTFHTQWKIVLTLVVVVIITTGCYNLFDDGIEIETNIESQDYFINPEAILNELNKGNVDVFQAQATPSSSKGIYSWNQTDFLRVAQAFHQKQWQVPLGAQSLNNLSFGMNCSDVTRGKFTEAIFHSSTVVDKGGEETRVEYTIRIVPTDNLIHSSKAEFSPNLKPVEPLDLTNYTVTADDALQIAENNGGTEKRSEFNNACRIDVIAPGPDSQGWRVLYQTNRDKWWDRVFEIAINPKTGSNKVIFPEP